MDETREDRMRSRMRGAARHQVSDTDFGTLFTIPTIAPEPASQPSSSSSDPPASSPPVPTSARSATKRTSPNTSAKRQRLEPETAQAATSSQAQLPAPPTSANRSSRRLPEPPPARSDPYNLENAPSPTGTERSTPLTRASARRSRELGSSGARKPAVQHAAPPPQSSPLPALPTDEVSESPVNAPGSGHRTRVRDASARDSSAILQSALRSVDSDLADGYIQSSSPLSRMSRKSIAGNLASAKSTRTGLRRSTRLSGSPDGEDNELASDLQAVTVDDTIAEEPATAAFQDDSIPEVAETIIEEPAEVESPEVDEAREINDREAAHRLGRKRPRRSIPAPSPELASEEASEEPEPEPVAKRPRKEAPPKKKKSPAEQRQPKAPRAKQTKPNSRRKSKGEQEDAAHGPPVGIAVQRFSKIRSRGDDSDDDDVLNTTIPHTNRKDVNAIDVLAQMCEEVIGATLKKYKESFKEAQDAPTKKELRVKISALGAFQEELRTRLLEHTIALDTLYSLKKRVREAQKEKLKLRERLMEIRTEREHVALRKDAVRAKYEEDSKEALHNISLSTAMHDIDLAIEQGRAAPELSAKEAKTAELANLELLISRVTEQACGGGTLGQIKGFNAFLERAMAVL